MHIVLSDAIQATRPRTVSHDTGLAQSHMTLAATRHSLLTAKQDWICAEEITCSPRNSFLPDRSTPNMAFSWCRIFFIVMVCNQPSAERELSAFAECLLYDLAPRTEARPGSHMFCKGTQGISKHTCLNIGDTGTGFKYAVCCA